MRTKPPSRAINFILWSFMMTIFAAGVVVGLAVMVPGGEVTGWVILLFVSFILGLVCNSVRAG